MNATPNPKVIPFMLALFCAGVLILGQPSVAQNAETEAPANIVSEPAPVVELTPLSAEQTQELDAAWVEIKNSAADIASLERRLEITMDITQQVLEQRVDNLLVQTIASAISLVDQVADLRDAGTDTGVYMEDVLWALQKLPAAIDVSAERLRGRVQLSDFDKPAAEQAAIDQQLFVAMRAYINVNDALMDTVRVAERFNVDLSHMNTDIHQHIESSAISTSVFLDLSVTEVSKIRAGLNVMPDDEELMGKLRAAEFRVSESASILEGIVAKLSDLELPTAQYKQQLLTATGALTATSLDLTVVSGLLQQWGAVIVDAVVEQGPNYIFQTLLFIGIIFIFLKISVLVQRGVDKALNANSQNVSQLLRRMISTTSKTIVIMFGVLIALSQFGISLGPLLTGLGIAGFIVGFALQDSLSNFASGMMILFYRPYDVGDTIVAGTVSGNVSSMSLVNTTIRTFDNQSLIIPNNKIWQDVITNLTDQTERRIDMEFGITYDEDIDRVEKLLFEVIAANKRVLENPKPDVVVGSFGDSSVNLLCRPWVKTADYWDVRFELHRQIKKAFDREGVVIPFPQRDVHMIQPESSIT